ncbi:MAG TPA: AAA family ATPase [Thermodesulfobacteriota bacterium]|nr:AAA family ATPase [Thermodesulfobacteriota bacterium]
MSMASNDEIDCLIRASYPIVYIVSAEEARVERALRSQVLPGLAGRPPHQKSLVTWSITEGFSDGTRPGGAPAGAGSRDARDPLRALELVEKSTERAIFLFRDFHPFLQDPTIVRKLRDLAHALKESPKTLLLLSPVLRIPPELEKEIAVVEYGLPTLEDLDPIIEEVIQSVRAEGKLDRFDVNLSVADREAILSAALGLTATEAENVFAKSLIQRQRFDVGVILSEKEQIIRKSGILEFYRHSEAFDDVGGLEALKGWLAKRTRAFTKEAREFGLPQPRGILLIGVPGCGKSLTAKAVGQLWRLPILRLDVGKVFAGLVGSSEENMRKAIRTAEAVAPAILWIDELEKGFAGTLSSGISDAGTAARVFGSFVTWLQEKTSPVFVIATANAVSLLPPELLRKGRFDEIFFVDLPTFEERESIFRIHLQKRGRDPAQFDLAELAAYSEGYSGAEIEQAIVSALYDAFDQGARPLTTADIVASLKETVPLSQTMSEEIAELREWASRRARPASTVLRGRGSGNGQARARQLEL